MLNDLFLYIILLSTIKWYNLQPLLNSLPKITLLTLGRILSSSVRPKGNLFQGGCALCFLRVLTVNADANTELNCSPAHFRSIFAGHCFVCLIQACLFFLNTQMIVFLYSYMHFFKMLRNCGELWRASWRLPWLWQANPFSPGFSLFLYKIKLNVMTSKISSSSKGVYKIVLHRCVK